MPSFGPKFAALAVCLGVTLRANALVLKNSTQSKSQQQEKAKVRDKQMHACLTNKRIVFVGPSTAKMDYLALAFFAEYGWWPSEDQVLFGLPGQSQWGVNPLDEGGIPMSPAVAAAAATPVFKPGCTGAGTEELVMRYTNYMLNGHETCDCHEFGTWKGAYDMYNSTENRLYNNGNTMISYFQWFGDIVQPRGTFDISPLLSIPARPALQQCPVGQFPGKWAWNMPVAKFLTDVIRHARPTHLVLSTSFWPITPTNKQFWDEIADAGVQAVMDSGGEVIWKTTPQRAKFIPSDHPPYVSPRLDMTTFGQKGWKLFPAQQVVSQFQGYQANDAMFYDFAHLRPAAQCFLVQNFLETHVCPGMKV